MSSAMSGPSDDEIVAEYRSSLLELQFNSKPHINMLTMLAEESQRCAYKIVDLIESRLFEAPVGQKLPILYLIDSIVKNCPGAPYKESFGKNLVKCFEHVFEQADERVRQSLFKLRQTWVDVFPASKLYRIDIKVHEIDPAWPLQEPSALKVGSGPPSRGNVYVNPKFMDLDSQSDSSSSVGRVPEKPYVAGSERVSHHELVRLQEELQSERQNIIGKRYEPGLPSLQDSSSAVALPVPTDPRIRKKEMEKQQAALSKPSDLGAGEATSSDLMQEGDFITIDEAVGPETFEDVGNRTVDHSTDFGRDSRLPQKRNNHSRRNRSGYTSPPRKRFMNRQQQQYSRSGVIGKDTSPPRRPRREQSDYRAAANRYQPKARSYQNNRRSRFDVRPDDLSSSSTTNKSPSYECSKMPMDNVIEPFCQPFLDPRIQARVAQQAEWKSDRGTTAMQPVNVQQLPLRRDVHVAPPAAVTMGTVNGLGAAFSRSAPPPQLTAVGLAAGRGPLAFASAPPPTHVSDMMGFERNAFPSILDRTYHEQQMYSGVALHQHFVGDVAMGASNFERSRPAPAAAAGSAVPPSSSAAVVGLELSLSSSAAIVETTKKAAPLKIVAEGVDSDSPMNNRLFVDGLEYEVRFIDEVAVIERNGLPHRIYFVGSDRDVVVDSVPYSLCFADPRTIMVDGQPVVIRFGAPSRELYIGNVPLRVCFGGPAASVLINDVRHLIQLCGPPPEVKIDPEPAYELIRYMSAYHAAAAKRPAEPSPVTHSVAANEASGKRSALLPPADKGPPAAPTENVMDLLDKLVKSGIIVSEPKKAAEPVVVVPPPPADIPLPPPPPAAVARVIPLPLAMNTVDVQDQLAERRPAPTADLKTFNFNCLKIRYNSVIDSLHRNKIQCSTCGMRFPVEENAKYAKHLDWHFKMNRRGKFNRSSVSRPWFLTLEDFVNYEELGEDITTKVKSSVFESMQKSRQGRTPDDNEAVTVATDFEHFCGVCHEQLEQFFDQNGQVWKLRNAMTVNNMTYHPLCYQDVEKHNRRVAAAVAAADSTEDAVDVDDDEHAEQRTKQQKREQMEEKQETDVVQLPNGTDLLQSILTVLRKSQGGDDEDAQQGVVDSVDQKPVVVKMEQEEGSGD